MNKLVSKVFFIAFIAFCCAGAAYSQVTWEYYSNPSNHCGISIRQTDSHYAMVCGGMPYLGASLTRLSFNCYFSPVLTERNEPVNCANILQQAYQASCQNGSNYYSGGYRYGAGMQMQYRNGGGRERGNQWGNQWGSWNRRPATNEPVYTLGDGSGNSWRHR